MSTAILQRLAPRYDPLVESIYRAGGAVDRRELDSKAEQHHVGAELLEKLRQPMLLIDNQRRITYRNRNAAGLLARRDLVLDVGGILTCRDADCDLALTLAMRDMGLVPITGHGGGAPPKDRIVFKLARRDGHAVAGTLLALRPEATLGPFSPPQALFTVFEPGAAIDIDPCILAMTFDLSPAEARLAGLVVNGRSPDECATKLGVKISTIRSQLISIYGKTGASGQADLVRLVLSATVL